MCLCFALFAFNVEYKVGLSLMKKGKFPDFILLSRALLLDSCVCVCVHVAEKVSM